MKKTYKAPLTEVVKLNGEEMLQVVSNFGVKADPISGGEPGFEKAGKDDEDYGDLW